MKGNNASNFESFSASVILHFRYGKRQNTLWIYIFANRFQVRATQVFLTYGTVDKCLFYPDFL